MYYSTSEILQEKNTGVEVCVNLTQVPFVEVSASYRAIADASR